MKLSQSLILPLLLAAAPMAVAQNGIVADSGLITGPSLTTGGPSVQAPGSLTTHFNGGNSFAGNMFDILPATDLTITAMDVHCGTLSSYDIVVWYRTGTSVGFENTSTGWTQLGSGTVTGAGAFGPTFVDLSGNGVTFTAGTTYGMYVESANYVYPDVLNYTNTTGVETYISPELSLFTNCGKGPGFSGSTFYDRAWNGTIYYDAGPAGPALAVANLVAGGTVTISVSNCTPGGLVRHGYSVYGGGPTSTPYGDLLLSPPYVELPALTADGAGNASMSASVPAGTSGVPVWLHALDVGSLTLTNGLAEVIG